MKHFSLDRRVLMTGIGLLIALASALPVQADGHAIDTPETVEVRSGALTLRGLLWRPAGRGPFPAVLFNHGSGPAADPSRPALLGPTFAKQGYLFHYLYRRGAGLSADEGTNSEELMNRAFASKGQEGRNEGQLQLLDIELGDARAGLAFLRAEPRVDARRIVVAGHSFGGQLALLLTERDAQLRAAVVFGAAAASWEASPKLRSRLLAAVGRTSVPVFFIHAANDFSVSSGKALAAEMTRLGKPNRVKIYPTIGKTPSEGHDFVHAGVRAWEPDVFPFLREYVQP